MAWWFAAGLAAGLALAVLVRWAWGGRSGASSLSVQTETLTEVKWGDGEDTLASLEKVVKQLSAILNREIRYYRRHRRRSGVAKGFRWLAWALGTMGVLCPLLVPMLATSNAKKEATLQVLEMSLPVTGLGFILLALAGALLAANQLLGLTSGHIRYVTAQLKLECLLTNLALRWTGLKAAHATSGGPIDTAKAFEIFELTRASLHELLLKETEEWASDVRAQEQAQRANSPRS